MHVSYACTFEEFDEAQRTHRNPSLADRPSLWERLLFVWVLLATLALVFAVLIGTAFYNVAAGVPRDAPSAVAPYLVSIVTPWMMWMIVFALLWFAFAASLSRASRRALRSFLLLVLGLVLVLNVIDIVTSGPHPAAANDVPGDQSESLLSALTPWVVVFLVLWFVIFRFLRGATRRAWDAQPQLRLPQTLEQTERGLRFDDGRSTHDYAWSAFTKFRESENVMLLYLSDLGFEIIPKRAFADAAQFGAFRALISQHVPSADRGDTAADSGHETIPFATVPAIPVEATRSSAGSDPPPHP
ncbi:MAG TPA: YcxB family protein [Tepidisphaeraceae bacterium]|nr:YcxB family protein [Tepidisphaeraceae bacterium]